MKIIRSHIIKPITLLAFLLVVKNSFGQGRVVINEFMSWSGCNTTSEFIELMNFGPGAMNIGCYIVTNGKYAVTIPPNTIVQPGQYFLLSGRDILAASCGNSDSAVHVDLNWTTCNCTNQTVPTTGDGFLQNGGNANEKVVLLDPNLNVIDAVSRYATPSSSVAIITSSNGGCTSKTFDLDLMGITYESIDNSTGIDNSFARKVDGDCGWVKTTAISANAPNKTGNTSSASYNFSTISASDCQSTTGSISIGVSATNVSSLFPMSYTLAQDKDNNYIYNTSDQYLFGVDNSAPSIDINNLAYGRYRITVASALGCNLKTYDFFIFNCYGILLPVKLVSFKHTGEQNGQLLFDCQLLGLENLKTLVVEGSNGDLFTPVSSFSASALPGGVFTLNVPNGAYAYYRLRLIDNKDMVSYSSIVPVKIETTVTNLLWPNPATDKVQVSFNAEKQNNSFYTISNALGSVVKTEKLSLKKGANNCFVSLQGLPAGVYQLSIPQDNAKQPICFRFVKQ